MNIYTSDNNILLTVPVTQEAEHEEELMKSDFVQLSWNDTEYVKIPVGAYIIPFPDEDGERYQLLQPYVPEQKNELEWRYAPQFHHPKMLLSKVLFEIQSNDTSGNSISLFEWPYVGSVTNILGNYFVTVIRRHFNFGDNEFNFLLVGGFKDKIINANFSANDVLSALSIVANACEAEWHIDWDMKTLYFGYIKYNRMEGETPSLVSGQNIGTTSIRESKEYWTCFMPQGSTRNIIRRAANAEFVQSDVRLSLNKERFRDGIIYTDGNGHVYGTFGTVDEYEAAGEPVPKFVKPVILEDVYPKQDMYVYNIRYRERYLMEEDDQGNKRKVVAYTDDEGVKHYQKYAVWYFQLGYKFGSGWKPFVLDEVVSMIGRMNAVNFTQIVGGTEHVYEGYQFTMPQDIDCNAFNPLQRWSQPNDGKYVIGSIEIEGINAMGVFMFGDYESRDFYILRVDNNEVWDEIVAIPDKTSVKLVIKATVDKSLIPKSLLVSRIIDGKKPIVAFQPNTKENAESTPLAGLGSGDGNGHYGFTVRSLYMEGGSYIAEANKATSEEGDTGIVSLSTGQRSSVTANDFEIEYERNGNTILPSTRAQGIHPKGQQGFSELNNKVSLYNVALDSDLEDAAKEELYNKAIEYIAEEAKDKNNYSFPSNPIAFEVEQRMASEESRINRLKLYIGREVNYNDKETRVIKLVTKLDHPFEQEITVGNNVIKGSQTQVKENVEAIIAGNMSVGGSGVSLAYLETVIKNWTVPRFLSKVANDTANGLIGFAKGLWVKGMQLFGINENGDAKLNTLSTTGGATIGGNATVAGDATISGAAEVGDNATIGGILTALQKVRTNLVESDNYTGDGPFDTGFHLTKNNANALHSYLVIDELFVRMKAVFNELEIRKISYSGGNLIFSHAGSKIIYVVEKEDSYRCYFKKDDGTSATENWWAENDQARCQTFGQVTPGSYTNVETTYYWRLVLRVGSEKVNMNGDADNEDGETYDYADLSKTDSDTGSTTPRAGDQIVQMGNRTNTGRQGFISIEVAGDNAPAFKVYKGVNSFSLENKRKVCLSPVETDIKANKFTIETETGSYPVPRERGEWSEITADGENHRRCYYYDLVQHSGSSWLCIYPESGRAGVAYTTEEPSETATDWRVYAQAGQRGADGEKGADGRNGEDGEDAVSVVVTPSTIIINQSIINRNNLSDLSSDTTARAIIDVYQGQTKCSVTGVQKKQVAGCNAYATQNFVQITAILQTTVDGKSQYNQSASVTVDVTYTDTNNASKTITEVKVPVIVNLIGTWKEVIEGDTKTAIAQQTYSIYDKDGNIVTTQNIAQYIQSSSMNTSILKSKVDSGNLLSGVLSAIGWTCLDSLRQSIGNALLDSAEYIRKVSGSTWLKSPSFAVEQGNDYTVSFVSADAINFIVKFCYDADAQSEETPPADVSYMFTTSQIRFAHTFRAAATMEAHIEFEVDVKYPQVELGSEATPFDASVNEKVSRLEQTVDGFKTEVRSELGNKVNTTTFNQTANNIRAEVKEVAVNQKNLLSGVLTAVGWTDNSPDGDTAYINAQGYICYGEDANTLYSPQTPLVAGQQYTLSFLGQQASCTLGVEDNTSPDPIDVAMTGTAEGSGVYKFVYTFTANNWVTFGFNQAIKHPQLELGSVATVFLPDNCSSIAYTDIKSDEVQIGVTKDLKRTGIDISSGAIDLFADKVRFRKSTSVAQPGDVAKVWIDANKGTLHATDGEFEGTVRATTLYKSIKRVKLFTDVDSKTGHNNNNINVEILPFTDNKLPSVLVIWTDLSYDIKDANNNYNYYTMSASLPKAELWQGHQLEVVLPCYTITGYYGSSISDSKMQVFLNIRLLTDDNQTDTTPSAIDDNVLDHMSFLTPQGDRGYRSITANLNHNAVWNPVDDALSLRNRNQYAMVHQARVTLVSDNVASEGQPEKWRWIVLDSTNAQFY